MLGPGIVIFATRRGRLLLQEAEVLDHRVAREADLAGDAQRLRDADAALKFMPESASIESPRRVLQEVEVPEGAAELAVRDRREADLLLLGDEGADLPSSTAFSAPSSISPRCR
jgi:hypothetical protein